MAITLDGTLGITSPLETVVGQFSSASTMGFKNRIINGAMVIDQRNAGALVTGNGYTLDRWQLFQTIGSKATVQQNAGSVTPPAGFTNYLGVTSTSAYSVLTGDRFFIGQNIEGFNFADMNWGTANAQAVTLSFKVYSSLTGTFGGVLQNYAGTRSYPFTYSIPVANTWTAIAITIAGDTTGTWVGASNAGVNLLNFSLGAGATYSGTAGAWASANYNSATGATSVVGTSGATLYITGVQLEKGSTATSFDYRPYGTELSLCQRYYQRIGNDAVNSVQISGYQGTGLNFISYIPFSVPMRATPTLVRQGTWNVVNCTQPNAAGIGANGFCFYSTITVLGSFSINNSNQTTMYLEFTGAEL